MKTTLKSLSPVLKLWLVSIVAFIGVTFYGDLLFEAEVSSNFVILSRALLFSAVVVLIARWYFKREKDGKALIGLQSFKQNGTKFLLGMSLLLGPLIVTVGLANIAGWAKMTFNPDGTVITQQLLGILVIFLFEAFPEEMLFRGLIFGKLKQQFSTKKSLLITSLLFVLLPVFAMPIQQLFFFGEVTAGGSTSLTGSYLIYMTIFAFMTGFMRILTNNIWTSTGFHMVFVSMNIIIGLGENSLIVISEQNQELPIQITLTACILILIGGLAVYLKRRKKNMQLDTPAAVA